MDLQIAGKRALVLGPTAFFHNAADQPQGHSLTLNRK